MFKLRACKAICPKDAISFKSTSIGRLKAVVNESCIDCEVCLKVCPSIDYHNLRHTFTDKYIGEIKSVYIGKANNKIFLKNHKVVAHVQHL